MRVVRKTRTVGLVTLIGALFLLLALFIPEGIPFQGLEANHIENLRDTTVCGPLAAPAAVGGIPVAYNLGSIQFQDNFILSLEEVPSFYLGTYGVFTISRRIVKEYGLMDPTDKDICALLFPEK